MAGTLAVGIAVVGILVVEDIVVEGTVEGDTAVVEVDIAVADILPFGQGCSWQSYWIMQGLWQAFAGVPNFAGRHLAFDRYEQ